MANLSIVSMLPTLSPDAELCRKQVLNWRDSLKTSEVRPICMTQLSSFLNPDEFKENRTAILSAVISIAIVKGSENGKLIAAIIDENEPYAQAAANILSVLPVPVFVGSLDDREAIDLFLSDISASGLPEESKLKRNIQLRGVTNSAERNTITAVKRALGILPIGNHIRNKILMEGKPEYINFLQNYIDVQKKRFNVFEEYALTKIVEASQASNYANLQKYRVDVLVASAAPKSKPLLVIEFDGQTHRQNLQRFKDDSRDTILITAQIPVLRIATPWDWNDSFFEVFIRLLVYRLVEVIEFDGKDVWPEEYKNELGIELDNKLREYQKLNSRIDVPDDVRMRIGISTLEMMSKKYSDKKINNVVDQAEAWHEWQKLSSLEMLGPRIRKEVQIIKPFNEVKSPDKETGFSVNAVVLIDGKRHAIASPRIRISIETSDDDKFDGNDINRKLNYERIIIEAARASSLSEIF